MQVVTSKDRRIEETEKFVGATVLIINHNWRSLEKTKARIAKVQAAFCKLTNVVYLARFTKRRIFKSSAVPVLWDCAVVRGVE